MTDLTPSQHADRALEILGPDGEHWTQGVSLASEQWGFTYDPLVPTFGAQAPYRYGATGKTGGRFYCLIGALSAAVGVESAKTHVCQAVIPAATMCKVEDAVVAVSGTNQLPVTFNDDPTTKWEDIRAVLEKVRADETA